MGVCIWWVVTVDTNVRRTVRLGANAVEGRSQGDRGKATWSHQAWGWWRNQSEEQETLPWQARAESPELFLGLGGRGVAGAVLCAAWRASSRNLSRACLWSNNGSFPLPQDQCFTTCGWEAGGPRPETSLRGSIISTVAAPCKGTPAVLQGEFLRAHVMLPPCLTLLSILS